MILVTTCLILGGLFLSTDHGRPHFIVAGWGCLLLAVYLLLLSVLGVGYSSGNSTELQPHSGGVPRLFSCSEDAVCPP